MLRLQSIVMLVLGLVLIVGCNAGNYSKEALKQRFVGKTKSELLTCAGVPNAKETVGDQEFLTYSTQVQTLYQTNLGISSCRLNFILTNGRVTHVQGKWSGHIINMTQACDRIVKGCWDRSSQPVPQPVRSSGRSPEF